MQWVGTLEVRLRATAVACMQRRYYFLQHAAVVTPQVLWADVSLYLHSAIYII
jgi:hypothetical protein